MPLNGLQQTQLQRLRLAIRKELDKCDKSITPNLCALIADPKGYADIQDIILRRVLTNKVTPYVVIGELESEQNEL